MCGYNQYTVIADSFTDLATERVTIEITPNTGTSIFIKRVRYSNTDVPGDFEIRTRVYRETTAATGGTAFTPVRMSPSCPSSTSSALILVGNTTFTSGTLGDKLLDLSAGARSSLEWIARDKDDYLVSNEGQAIAVTTSCSTSGITKNSLTVDFLE